MNLKNRLKHIVSKMNQYRAVGRTTYNARIARENGGMVLAASFDEAKHIERQHGVTARSVEQNLDGYTGPFFLDHHAAEILLLKAANKIDELEYNMTILQSFIKENTGMELEDVLARHRQSKSEI